LYYYSNAHPKASDHHYLGSLVHCDFFTTDIQNCREYTHEATDRLKNYTAGCPNKDWIDPPCGGVRPLGAFHCRQEEMLMNLSLFVLLQKFNNNKNGETYYY
jgi:hypothetical protein